MGFLGLPHLLWAVLALIVAGIFVVFVPYRDVLENATGFSYFVLRWMHSLIWLFLAISFALRATENPSLVGLANLFGPVAGIMYAVFIITLIQNTR